MPEREFNGDEFPLAELIDALGGQLSRAREWADDIAARGGRPFIAWTAAQIEVGVTWTRSAQGGIDVKILRHLRSQYGISGKDVASIQVAGSRRMATTHNILAPRDIMLAQFSIPFCVALALDRDAIDPSSFDEAAVRDPAILALASQVKMTAVPGQGDDDVSSTVELTLKDGRVLTQRVTEFLGTPARPLTARDLRQKFLLLTQKYPAPQMERLFERLEHIEGEANLDWLQV